METSPKKPIIFFDGVCGLCNEFVDMVMKLDPQAIHMFSPLQGTAAERFLTVEERTDLDSVVLVQDGVKLKKSKAVFQILKNLGGPWKVIAVLGIIPAPITDVAYKLVARFRYKLFDKKESCRLPTPAERQRFLN